MSEGGGALSLSIRDARLDLHLVAALVALAGRILLWFGIPSLGREVGGEA